MCRTENSITQYAPLYIFSFKLITSHNAELSQNLNEMKTMPDKLKWLRHSKGLLQKDVAAVLDISRAHYTEYENGKVDYIPKETADKLADFYAISPADFLDNYNLFIYNGQGETIKKYRESLNLKLKPFARLLGISHNLLRAWENDKKRVTKKSWEKCFKNRV